jgi:probable F420-dependent oxidoreductase
MQLPRVGVWTSVLGVSSAGAARDSARSIEELGYGAVWFPEGVGSKEAFTQAAMLLGWTDRIAVATGIANIYARDAMATASAARGLAEAYPGRFVLGIGVSHAPAVAKRGGTYGRPVETMQAYLDAMDAALYRGPQADETPTVLAALGPRMLELAAERTLGAHPYFVPVEHTLFARKKMGPGPVLAPEQAVVLTTDATKARAVGRAHMRYYLELDNYRRNLVRLGWGQADLAGDCSDELVDAIVAWGDEDAIAARVKAHLDAGANHVCIQALGEDPTVLALDDLSRLAPVLLSL